MNRPQVGLVIRIRLTIPHCNQINFKLTENIDRNNSKSYFTASLLFGHLLCLRLKILNPKQWLLVFRRFGLLRAISGMQPVVLISMAALAFDVILIVEIPNC